MSGLRQLWSGVSMQIGSVRFALRTCVAVAGCALFGCGDDSSTVDSGADTAVADSGGAVDSGNVDSGNVDSGNVDSGNVDSGSVDSGGPEAELLLSIAGTWHGQIGPGYAGGCLCLTLDNVGNVIEPSGITLAFDVTGGDTTVLDADAREVDIRTVVEGSPFHIRGPAQVDADGTMIDGRWESEPSGSAFDNTIVLDREPESCMDRTGLDGAPC